MKRGSIILALLLIAPTSAKAAVYISEVAWMGSLASANQEWIELKNDGGAVDVTGWKLTDGMNLNIELAGTIPENSHIVLERTSDDSASGSAFLIYSGALVNTGATLKLQRVDGSIEDQVGGGDNWSLIGGDNITKETAQYSSSGWVTAVATPGRDLPSVAVVVEDDTPVTTEEIITTKNTSSSNKKDSETVKLTLPDNTLQIKVISQTFGYVNQTIDFEAKTSGIGNTLIDSLTYEWNFGDGLTSNSKSPKHIFKYPGTYLVTVYAGFKRQEQVARYEITILPVEISLTKNKAGDIQINNDSPYEIDISGYRLQSGTKFILPNRSIILPNQTITIPKQKIGFVEGGRAELYDNENLLLISFPIRDDLNLEQTNTKVLTTPSPIISATSISRQSTVAEQNFGFSGSVREEEALPEENISEVVDEQAAAVIESVPKSSSKWPYLALLSVLTLGVFGIYLKPIRKENT